MVTARELEANEFVLRVVKSYRKYKKILNFTTKILLKTTVCKTIVAYKNMIRVRFRVKVIKKDFV